MPAPIGEAVERGGRWFCVTRHVPGAPVRDESEAQRRQRGRIWRAFDVALRELGEHLRQRPGWRPQHTGPPVHEDVDWDQCLAVLGARDTRLQDWAATAAAAIAAELATSGGSAAYLRSYTGTSPSGTRTISMANSPARSLRVVPPRLAAYELAIARTHRSPETIASYADEMTDLRWPFSDLEQATIGPVHRAFRVSMTAWVIDEARNGKSLDVAMIERQLRLTGVPPP